MVIIYVKDGDGRLIENARINDYKSFPHEEYEIVIDSYNIFSRDELLLIQYLLAKAIDYGGEVEEIRNYIELFDKIKKIVDLNDCK